MNKKILPVLLSLVFILSACTGNSTITIAQANGSSVTTTATTNSSVINTNYTDAVSIATQLAVGTLNLDGTANAITKDQASALVTLWKSLQSKTQQAMPVGQGGQAAGQQPGGQGSAPSTNSSTDSTLSADQSGTPAAPGSNSASQATQTDNSAEVDALITQIEAAMTTDQLSSIAAMQLTQTSVDAILKAKGITTDAVSAAGMGAGAPGGTNSNSSTQPQGNPPTGKDTGNSANGAPAQGTPPAAMPTPDATQQANGTQTVPGNGQGGPGNGQQPGSGQMGMGMNSSSVRPPVLNAVIQYLAGLAGVTVPTAQAPANGGTTGAAAGGNQTSGGIGPGGNGSSTAITSFDATYTVDGEEASQSSQSYSASKQDTSAVFVTNAGKLTLNNAAVTTTGSTSSTDNSSFYGLNAAVLANQGAALTMSGGTVTTSGTGANGVFATGTGSTVALSDMTIKASGDGGHAVMATLGGVMTISNVNMTTSGGSSSAIATDRGGGTITVSGGTINTSGNNSAGIYSTGSITADGTTFISSGAEAAVIEGGNSITLTDSKLTSTKADKWGVLIYQSMSGDAEGTEGTFTMTGGSLAYSATGGSLFYVTNSTANILLKNVDLTATSGILFKAGANSWGTSGANGGNIVLTADSQTLTGSVVLDAISTADLTLKNTSTLTGAINSENTAKQVNLTLDASSLWNVTADSYITCLSDSTGISGTSISNINGNGHTVYYDSGSCSVLNGKTYTLNGSGTLQPAK